MQKSLTFKIRYYIINLTIKKTEIKKMTTEKEFQIQYQAKQILKSNGVTVAFDFDNNVAKNIVRQHTLENAKGFAKIVAKTVNFFS